MKTRLVGTRPRLYILHALTREMIAGCAVALSDKSVSRLHAELTVVHAKEDLAKPDQRPRLSITDRSRFGTLRNGGRVPAGEPIDLDEGDELKFGVNQDTYRVSFEPLVVYWGSKGGISFTREEQAHILKALHTLGGLCRLAPQLLVTRINMSEWVAGGHVAYDPELATISVMKEIAVTSTPIQLLHSLTRGLPTVTPAFLQALLSRATLSDSPPPFTEYQPHLCPYLRANLPIGAQLCSSGSS